MDQTCPRCGRDLTATIAAREDETRQAAYERAAGTPCPACGRTIAKDDLFTPYAGLSREDHERLRDAALDLAVGAGVFSGALLLLAACGVWVAGSPWYWQPGRPSFAAASSVSLGILAALLGLCVGAAIAGRGLWTLSVPPVPDTGDRSMRAAWRRWTAAAKHESFWDVSARLASRAASFLFGAGAVLAAILVIGWLLALIPLNHRGATWTYLIIPVGRAGYVLLVAALALAALPSSILLERGLRRVPSEGDPRGWGEAVLGVGVLTAVAQIWLNVSPLYFVTVVGLLIAPIAAHRRLADTWDRARHWHATPAATLDP